ncbi:ABC transporter substrate-binding protein [Paenibacillus sp. ACRRX]|uniref:ABC transporter substrate-binding protein n=1 Tax=Paenibacillus sp. ACRRX TaxID=2918206 RepID=UPI001EF4EAAA|nr:ABC transporter substrate-binding protein [Paenibacillus sp. ACRRX]MCG7409251.1 ABC transporter substrate-binding protein [Paenibacillus sp. ACRRX]
MRTRKRSQIFGGVVIAVLFSTACGNTTHNDAILEVTNEAAQANKSVKQETMNKHYPVTLSIYSDEGKEMKQTIETEPKRVVVVGSAMAELMIAFGLEDKVVGLGYLDQSFSKYEDQISQLPILSDLWPSKESVIDLQPDIIYAMSSAFKEDRLGEISFWNERGISVITASNFTIGRSIEHYMDDIRNFGVAFDVEGKTEAFIKEQTARITKVKQTSKSVQNRPNVLLIASAGRENFDYYPPSWSVIDEMIEGSGGKYVELSDGYMEMSIEAIIAANPEKIVLTQFQDPNNETIKTKLLSNDRLQNVEAIKKGNVMVVDYTNAIRGSLQLADLYEDVAAFIHPEQYGGQS